MSQILLVEDDPTTRDFLARLLMRSGHQVHLAGDGAEALEKLKDAPAELIVLDMMMPRMDGLEFLQRLRAHDDQNLRELPVILVTALSNGPSVAAAREQAQGHFVKGTAYFPEMLQAIERLT